LAEQSSDVLAQQPIEQGQLITITTDVMRAQIDTLGGSLVYLELLKHQDKQGKPVVLFNQHQSAPIYLARSGLVGANELPNHRSQFRVLPGPTTLVDGQNQLTLALETEKAGIKLTKSYVFKRDSYEVDVNFDIQNQGTQPISPTLYLELLRDGSKIETSHFYSTFTGPAVYTDTEKFKKIEFSDIDKGKAKYPARASKGETSWISFVQHYFVTAWIPDNQTQHDIYIEKLDSKLYRIGVKQALGTLPPGSHIMRAERLFAGPQEEPLLETVAPNLELVKDYGWLTIIAKPLFWLLEKFHNWLNNWGWAIVLLTVLIKLIFFPLSAASYKSMARMKDLQPRIAALRERHKNDPQKVNQAMMEMYKKEKINPLGGCLPILIQIPVFIALYWVLLASVEMRNAPWIGWIHDLSAPDPYYILPVLMALSMFLQIKLNPTPPDPLQAKIMLFVQLGFSVMFFFFPAGLVLYWVVNNILSILQQWQITRMHTGKK
jgi:YidC/Oxa1 family membrane protein insertase